MSKDYKTFAYVDEWGRDHTIRFRVNQYLNGRLAIECDTYVDDPEYGCGWEPYAGVTVNLVVAPIDGDDCAYLDFNNSGNLCEWILLNDLATACGRVIRSGFCEYPEVRFTDEFFKAAGCYDEEG